MHHTDKFPKSMSAFASPWRRIAAYLVDYFLFMVPLIGLLSFAAWIFLFFEINPLPGNAWGNHGIMILLLTLPIVVYFAMCESSRYQGTIGKVLMRVAVEDGKGGRARLKQTAIRAILKFLPWEFFHAIYWHWEGWPLNPAPPTMLQITGLSVGWLVIGCFLLSLFITPRRTPYDWAAGTVVMPRVPSANQTS